MRAFPNSLNDALFNLSTPQKIGLKGIQFRNESFSRAKNLEEKYVLSIVIFDYRV